MISACPGRFFSQDNLYCAVTGILASFSITAAQDAQGNDIPLKAEMSSGSLSCVEFTYNFSTVFDVPLLGTLFPLSARLPPALAMQSN